MTPRTSIIRQRVRFSAPPPVVYRALTSSREHSAFTEAPARIAARVGGAMSAYGGYITGSYVEVSPGRGFVQRWRTTEFPKDAQDSLLEIRLAKDGSGTRLTMVHRNVPPAQAKAYDAGWQEHYWRPLRAFLRHKKPKPAGTRAR